MGNINLVHEDELADNNLKVSDLPTEIKAKITGLKMSLGRYAKSPSESAKDAIEKTSAQIAHAIMDFVEKDLEEEPENNGYEQVQTPPQTPPQQNSQQVQTPTPQQTQTQEQVQAQAEAKALAYTLETQEANNEKERLEKIRLQEQAEAEAKAKAQAEKEARDSKGIFSWLGY